MKLIRNHAVSDMARPNPLPRERESCISTWQTPAEPSPESSAGTVPPSPWGEGRGEGGRKLSAAAFRSSVCVIALSLLTAGILSAIAAEPDTAAPAPPGVTQITSQTVDFDLKARQAVYHGKVNVQDPRIHLTCERLTATIAESGGRVDSLVAESNVVANIATNDTVYTVTSQKATYTYQVAADSTNQTLELIGSPWPTITWPPTNVATGRRIFWDIGRGKIKIDEPIGRFPNVDALKKVAEPAPATNAVVAPKPANP
jgi:lipopolysaccharide export system protein LptA